MTVDFEIDAAESSVEPSGRAAIRVKLRGVSLHELIEGAGEKDILEEIGKDRVMEYFDLKDANE